MNKFKYPFILKYVVIAGKDAGNVTYAKEGKSLVDFTRVKDPLEATVYKNSKQFRKFFEMTATEFLRMNGVQLAKIIYCEAVHVGE